MPAAALLLLVYIGKHKETTDTIISSPYHKCRRNNISTLRICKIYTYNIINDTIYTNNKYNIKYV
ncbi:hypothetical protein CVS40_0412 [Lucilia cuprina]|nr:hypothetical protein CVS40_0412 [Lucilia cuprina]